MRKIEFTDRIQIENIRTKYSHELSSHAFTNLYIWQETMGLSIELKDDAFFVKAGMEGKNTFFYPCGSLESQLMFIRKYMNSPEFAMIYLRGKDKEFLEEQFPGVFTFQLVEESCEYIYSRDSFGQLQGKKNLHIRKQTNHLKKHHDLQVIPLRDEDETAVRHLLAQTNDRNHMRGYHAMLDDRIPELVLQYRKELGIGAAAFWEQGELIGVIFGFPLTEDTIDACIERHDTSIQGLCYYMQMELLKQSNLQYRYLNTEEDLGVPGLRSMKQNLHPCRMNEVWSARIKNPANLTME